MQTKNLKVTTVVSFVLMLFTAYYFLQSLGYDYWIGYGPGAGFVPRWCSGIMLVLTLISFLQSFFKPGILIGDIFPTKMARDNILIVWGALVFFVASCDFFGFMVTSMISLSILFHRGMGWKRALIYSALVAIACFFLFKSVLQVPIPVNRFGW